MGRSVYLAFDADYGTNSEVRQALFRTVLAFTKLGAIVRVMRWDTGKGIDDHLVAQPDPKAAVALLQKEAVPIKAVLRPEDLTVLTAELRRAQLSPAQYSQFTRTVAEPLNVRASSLEQDVAPPQKDKERPDREITFPLDEPWPDPVDGKNLITELCQRERTHVVMSPEGILAKQLWMIHTFLADITDISPYLILKSPEKGCGKTVAMDVLSRLALRALFTSNIKPASLYRTIERHRPTLLIDEADRTLPGNDELCCILNAGHRRAGAYVIRCNQDTLDPERFVASDLRRWPSSATARSRTPSLTGVLSSASGGGTGEQKGSSRCELTIPPLKPLLRNSGAKSFGGLWTTMLRSVKLAPISRKASRIAVMIIGIPYSRSQWWPDAIKKRWPLR